MDKLLHRFKKPAAVVVSEVNQLRRNEYSVISCGELTPGVLAVWSELPDQVKFDPAFVNFRETYEKSNGKVSTSHADESSCYNEKQLSAICREDNNDVEEDINETTTSSSDEASKEPTRAQKIGKHLRVGSLLCCWTFFTVAFMVCNEKQIVETHGAVGFGDTLDYHINATSSRILIRLDGPFQSERNKASMRSNRTESVDSGGVRLLRVWLESKNHSYGTRKSEPWNVILAEPIHDFTPGEMRTSVLSLDLGPTSGLTVRVACDANTTIAFSMSYALDPFHPTTGVICGAVILLGLYILICFEVINRTLAAMIASTCALAVLSVLGERPTLREMFSWVDAETLLLLFSMMLLVALTVETGIFDFLAVFAFSMTKGKTWGLINMLIVFTILMSLFLDNVTTVLLMTPVNIRLCELMELNPVPMLMAMVVYSNIGGTATPVGDPPNVIIASNPDVIQHGINFGNFTIHMTVGVALVCLQTYLQLRFMWRDVNKLRISVPEDVQELRQQIIVWRKAIDSLGTHTQDENKVREALERRIAKLERRLKVLAKLRKKRSVPPETFQNVLASLREKNKIRDVVLLVKAAVAITFVVAVLFLHSIPELKRVSLGWTALLGAILLLVLAQKDDLEHVMGRVEWATLLFFASLFVLMEALSKLGLIQWIGDVTESLILQVSERHRLTVAIVLIIWVSGTVSSFVDNIPLTSMMVRVATSIGTNPRLGLPMAPLIWALSFGANLGGNGTLIGASANVVTAGVAEQHGYKFTFAEFLKTGFPLMVGHLVTATAYMLISHCLFEWH